MPDLKWIQSAGGPLVVLPEEALNVWSGRYKRDLYLKGVFEEADNFLNRTEADYGKACSVDDFLGVIEGKKGSVLVLGDEPLPTTLYHSSKNEAGIARVYYGKENIEEVINGLSINKIIHWKFGLTVAFNSNNQFLFDAALAGEDLKNLDEFLSIRLTPGLYKVFTHVYEPDEETKLLLHRLTAAD